MMNPAQPSVPTRVQTPEMSPLLFGLVPMEQPTVTPQRRVSPMRGAESSLSTQRRSVMTPGSLHTTGGVPPPPIMRLQDDITPEQPTTSAQLTSPAYLTPMTASILPQERAPQYDDTWVTVYGFSQSDVPVILKEFTKCGDVIQWGTFGQPQANFLHIQFQNKFAAQRALTRNGEQLSPTLIVGVKPLDPRHKAAVEAFISSSASPSTLFTPKLLPERPYKVDVAAAQRVPTASRSLVSKFVEFVLGA